MNRLTIVILSLALTLVAIVTGCSGAHRYDSRLVAADSLMQADPDSALAIIEAVNPDSLTTPDDRAYRDLLRTQARYKCYADIIAGDDSAATRAITCYKQHSREREKLTRAYLYKGAVMEELGHPDSAMFFYKTAEAKAALDDYFNLGYAAMRIATLYQDQLSQDTTAKFYLKKAILCFETTNDTNYLISCYGDLGGLYGIMNHDSAEFCLNTAIKLAQKTNSPKQYTYKSRLAGFYFYRHQDYTHAKDLAMEVFNYGKNHSKDNQFYLYATLSYLRIGLLDSAKYVLAHTPQPVDAVDSMNLLNAIAEIAKAEGNLVDYGKNAVKSRELNSQIISDSKDKRLTVVDLDFNNQQDLKNQNKKHIKHIAILLLVLLLIISTIIYIVHRQSIKRNDYIKGILKELENVKSDSSDELDTLQQNIEKLKIRDDHLKGFISSHMSLMSELIDACYHTPNSTLSEQVKKIIQFQHDNKSKWTQLYHYIDAEHNNIIEKTRSTYPQLNEKDLLLIALTCMGFSYIQIAIIMGYSNATSVSTIKQRLAKKMHLEGSLNDYINDMTKG